MPDLIIRFTEQEIQRIEAILLDKDKNEALRFVEEVLKGKLKRTPTTACGPSPVTKN
jgi:hypothetical protein